MLPVAYVHHKCPSFGELASLPQYSRVSHTSQSRSALKQQLLSHPEEAKAIQSRLRPPVRSLLDVDTLKSMLLKKDEAPSKAKTKEKLPPLAEIATTPTIRPEKIVRISKESSYSCTKHQLRSTLDPISHSRVGKSGGLQSPGGKLEQGEVDKSLRILKITGKARRKRDIYRRNRSIDLKGSEFEDKTGICSRTFDSNHTEKAVFPSQHLAKTFSEGLQRFSETGSDSSEAGANFQGVTTGEIVFGSSKEAGMYPYLTLKPSESRSSPVLSRDEPNLELAHPECSCSSVYFKQTNLHYRQLFHSKPGKRSAFPKPQALFVDNKATSDTKQTLAIYFDGVLGDTYKRSLTDTSPKSIRLRKSTEIGLLWLQQTFHLVFVTALSRGRATRILTYFRSAKIGFVGAYLAPGGVGNVLDYTEMCSDLHIRPHNLLIVSSLDMAYEDLDPVTEETLYTKAGSKIKLTANALPISRKSPPVSFLVPSLKPQKGSEILPFDLIAGAIQKVRRSKDWGEDFKRVRCGVGEGLATVTTEVVYEAALSLTLPVPKADSIRRGQKAKCPLHHTLTWPEQPSRRHSNELIVLTQKPNAGGAKGGFETIETKALRVKSGFLNLLDYTTIENCPQKVKLILDENI